MTRGWLLALVLLLSFSTAKATDRPEARPFVESANANAEIDAAIASNDKGIIVVMGANWCHDSRALAGWFASPRFAAMLRGRYQIVYVDSGSPQTGKGRNLDIANRFGVKKMKSTPLVFVLSSDGKMLNSRKDAVSWRNAATRSENAIYRYFATFTPA
jgi:thioredoxin-like negative regulator of GroEL